MRKQLCILGSTGSIGRQALQVVAEHSDRFDVRVLTAHRSADLLIEQARTFLPQCVVVADETLYERVNEALADTDVQVYAGNDALCQVVQLPSVDMVLSSLVGFSGLRPTVAAIEAGKAIALANKETLVVAGELITRLAQKHRVPILPVDSEHSAIFQSLMGESAEIEKLILTASGGPFRLFSLDELAKVTSEQALRHPNWDMGAKITIDSASMMNKGFEMIEAKWLFGVEPEDIQVVVHPQSIIHSAVQFTDGAVKAQLGMPDMRVPIQLALSFPERISSSVPRLNWFEMGTFSFEAPDPVRFRPLALAYQAIACGGNAPCVLNAANEVVNLAFRQGRCGFLQMSDVIEQTMSAVAFQKDNTLDDYVEWDKQARRVAASLLA
ncbi:MAG: 1-deoxy-D-xylulose-5-phosphate reductoisomerase [Bacteroidales bacterium]|nr:1-deoxy-D-xylulose-5-phosphate reductoisomerase [Candidatus Physcousia equi]